MNEKNYVLYVLVRNDLTTMGEGKKIAQGAHAAQMFPFLYPPTTPGYREWSTSAPAPERVSTFGTRVSALPYQGFGTTISKDVNLKQLYGAVDMAQRCGFPARVCHDPTYPVADGVAVPMDTCGFIFGDANELRPLLGQYNLVPND